MIARRRLPVKQNPQSFLHPRKIAENRRKTQKRCNLNLQMGCGLDRQNDLEWLPLLPGCGTQHPHRALGGTCVLLAAAPTTPPCFRRRRRSSLLQRKNYFYFRGSGKSAELVGAKPLHLLTQTALPLKSPTGAFIAAQTRTFLNPFFTEKEY